MLEEGMKLSKPEWREWMDIFVKGMRVSERNVVVAPDEEAPKAQSAMENDSHNLGAILQTEDENPNPLEIVKKVKKDPIYN